MIIMSKTTTKLLHNTTYLMSKKTWETISAEQTFKRGAIKRFLYSRETAMKTNEGKRYAKEV